MSRSVYESEKASITPDFLPPKDSSKETVNPSPETTTSIETPTKSNLKALESPGPIIKYSPKTIENSPSSIHYASQKPTQKKSRLKRLAPISFIMTIISAFASVLVFFILQLGFHVNEQLNVGTNADYAISALYHRSNTAKILSGSIKPKSTDFFERLEKQGIKVSSAGSGYELDFNGKKINSENFNTIVSEDADFRDAFTRANRGRIANLYDESADHLYKELGLTRNTFKNYKQTGDTDLDEKAYQEIYTKQFSDEATATTLNTAEDTTATDKDGNKTSSRAKSGDDLSPSSISGTDKTAKATSYISEISGKVAKGFNSAALGCAVLKVGAMVSTAVATYDTYQSIHNFMLEMEIVSKTKAGEGNNAAMNTQNNKWTTESKTKVLNATTGKEEEVVGTPLNAEGMKSLISNEPINKEKIKNYSINRGLIAAFTAIATNGLATNICTGVQAANAIISLATLAAPGSGFIKVVVGSLITNIAAATILQVTVSGILAGLVPIVAETLFTNPADYVGIPAGEQLAKGAAAHGTIAATANSGLAPSTKESALTASKTTKKILAEEAEIDRKNHSPFDPTSENTFLGTITNRLFPAFIESSAFNSATKVASLANSTFSPKLFADTDEDSSFLTTFGDCPEMEEWGIAGDAYCIGIVSGDSSLADLTDDDPTYSAWKKQNVATDKDGNETIIPGSFLAEYIELVAGRRSTFGIYDAGIADRALEYVTGGLSSVGESIPFVSDVVDLVSLAENAEVEPWARGTICLNSADNPRWDSDCKYAIHFILKTRTLDQIGFYGSTKNAVATFRDSSSYLNPTDTSRPAILARYSGLPYEDADTIIATFDYLTYVATYDPSSAYTFSSTPKTTSTRLNITSHKNTSDTFAIISKDEPAPRRKEELLS